VQVAAIPLAFVLLKSGWVWNNDAGGWATSFYVVFLLMMFLDGVMIAFANVVDIDCGGTDLIAAQYSVTVNDALRTSFNSIHEGFFNLSMIVFAPFLAWVSYFAVQHWTNAQDAAAIGGTLSFIFLVLSLVSLYQVHTYTTLLLLLLLVCTRACPCALHGSSANPPIDPRVLSSLCSAARPPPPPTHAHTRTVQSSHPCSHASIGRFQAEGRVRVVL
jgi:hypothetical protein